MYIHEREGWPNLTWRSDALAQPLGAVRHRQGRLAGRMAALGFESRQEAALRAMTEDVVKSSEIEGEVLDRNQVRSSIARRLGMDIGGLVEADRHVEGVVEMVLDATQNYAAPLTKERLFAWHAALFPTGRSGMARITVGAWRTGQDGPMRVVSGPVHRERVHFEAPSADRLDGEMAAFLDWFETAALDPVLQAGIAHFWFVTIHPLDDGNGRIARAIADLALARGEQTPQRFYSLSTQMRTERQAYYDKLEQSQKGDLDITGWLLWFLGCLDRALGHAEILLGSVLHKARVWQALEGHALNARQRKVINRLLDGFEGKLTNAKWASITRTSSDTALRDINDLVQRAILFKDAGGGRSTSYRLAELAQLEAGKGP